MKKRTFYLIVLLILSSMFFVENAEASKIGKGKVAPKPLFRDPIYDGAADPVIIWNKNEKKWFMFYTNRRAKDLDADGVEWVHGTRIGIAESKNGVNWTYRDTADINYRLTDYTHWAPDVIEHEEKYHMYLTYVPGVFKDWRHPRNIIHLTSDNLINWNFESILKLASDKVIDACVFRMPDRTWRMWYNNELAGKAMYYADSPDLYNWTDKGRVKIDRARGGEGPVVFHWKNTYWMITDVWDGLAFYKSDDLENWTSIPENLLQHPGKGEDDKVMGGHADVLINNDRAYLFYFTHPDRRSEVPDSMIYEKRRSSIQVVELFVENGKLVCDRDAETRIKLKKPKK